MDKPTLRPITSPLIGTQAFKKANGKPVIAQQPFAMHLQAAIQTSSKLAISKHAKERLSERNIEISEEKWAQIEEKVSKAKKMGVKDSLVILNDAALIVSAKNNTVITAMDRKEASSQIFTNINGTILVDS